MTPMPGDGFNHSFGISRTEIAGFSPLAIMSGMPNDS